MNQLEKRKVKQFVVEQYIIQIVGRFIKKPFIIILISSIGSVVLSLIYQFLFSQNITKFNLILMILAISGTFIVINFYQDIKEFRTIHKTLNEFKDISFKEQLRRIEIFEAEQALRKSQKKRGN